jgi:hypothetical protein
MAQTAAHLVDHVIPNVPVRQWVLFIADSAASSIRGPSASALAGIAGHSARHFHFSDQTGGIQAA